MLVPWQHYVLIGDIWSSGMNLKIFGKLQGWFCMDKTMLAIRLVTLCEYIDLVTKKWFIMFRWPCKESFQMIISASLNMEKVEKLTLVNCLHYRPYIDHSSDTKYYNLQIKDNAERKYEIHLPWLAYFLSQHFFLFFLRHPPVQEDSLQ